MVSPEQHLGGIVSSLVMHTESRVDSWYRRWRALPDRNVRTLRRNRRSSPSAWQSCWTDSGFPSSGNWSVQYVKMEFAVLMQIHAASCFHTNFLVDTCQPPYLVSVTMFRWTNWYVVRTWINMFIETASSDANSRCKLLSHHFLVDKCQPPFKLTR